MSASSGFVRLRRLKRDSSMAKSSKVPLGSLLMALRMVFKLPVKTLTEIPCNCRDKGLKIPQ